VIIRIFPQHLNDCSLVVNVVFNSPLSFLLPLTICFCFSSVCFLLFSIPLPRSAAGHSLSPHSSSSLTRDLFSTFFFLRKILLQLQPVHLLYRTAHGIGGFILNSRAIMYVYVCMYVYVYVYVYVCMCLSLCVFLWCPKIFHSSHHQHHLGSMCTGRARHVWVGKQGDRGWSG